MLLLGIQENHAHEDVLLLGNTKEEAQVVSGKSCLGSWEMQEELEDEVKLSVGKQPSPVAVLCLQGSPDPQIPFRFVACQGHSTSESPDTAKTLGIKLISVDEASGCGVRGEG